MDRTKETAMEPGNVMFEHGWWTVYATAIGTFRAVFHYGEEYVEKYFDTEDEARAYVMSR